MGKHQVMKNSIVIVVTTLVLGIAPISSAMAFNGSARTGHVPYDVETTGSFNSPFGGDYDRDPVTCPQSSAAEGNANQQNFPVKQYGQTAGGNRC
jgi:hypothetical protein